MVIRVFLIVGMGGLFVILAAAGLLFATGIIQFGPLEKDGSQAKALVPNTRSEVKSSEPAPVDTGNEDPVAADKTPPPNPDKKVPPAPKEPLAEGKVKVPVLFQITVKGGEVKKVSGMKVTFIANTPDLKNLIKEKFAKAKKTEQERQEYVKANSPKTKSKEAYKAYNEKYDKWWKTKKLEFFGPMKTIEQALKNQAAAALTDAQGGCEVSLPAGNYLVFTERVKIGHTFCVWTKPVDVSEGMVKLMLDQDVAVIYEDTKGTFESASALTMPTDYHIYSKLATQLGVQ